MIVLKSFSFRDHVLPAQGENVIDCRGLKNPYKVPLLKPLTGLDLQVKQFVFADPGFHDVMRRTFELVKTHQTIFYGCFGGKHRSVACVELMAEGLREMQGIEVQTEHLSLPRAATTYNQ